MIISMLTTGALLGARLGLRPRAAVEALVRAGLLLLREDPGLLSNRVGGGDDHQRLRPPLPVLLRRLLLVSGRRGLHRAGAEHGEICQAPILVHQSAGVGTGGRLKTGPNTHTHTPISTEGIPRPCGRAPSHDSRPSERAAFVIREPFLT